MEFIISCAMLKISLVANYVVRHNVKNNRFTIVTTALETTTCLRINLGLNLDLGTRFIVRKSCNSLCVT